MRHPVTPLILSLLFTLTGTVCATGGAAGAVHRGEQAREVLAPVARAHVDDVGAAPHAEARAPGLVVAGGRVGEAGEIDAVVHDVDARGIDVQEVDEVAPGAIADRDDARGPAVAAEILAEAIRAF